MENKKLFNYVIIFLIIYILIGIFLFLNQKSFIYFPNNQNFYECVGFLDYEKINLNKTRFYYKKGIENKIIIYYHGNAGSACDRSNTKEIFETTNASIIFVEYSGYSNDNRKPSKKLILEDVEKVFHFINENNYNKTIVFGKSLGSGAASYHAYLGRVNLLILVNPFSELNKVAQSKYYIYPTKYLLTENYNNFYWLKNYKENIIIIHGEKDLIIPPKFSKELYEKINNDNKEYLLIENVGHNDIWSSYKFQNTIIEYINNI